MAKFYGEVGYVDGTVERDPGVFVNSVVEFPYFGDIEKPSRRLQDGPSVNNDAFVTNPISIIADAYANEHFFAIQYVRWRGALWTVTTVEVQRPRLLLRLGGLYNGPTPSAP